MLPVPRDATELLDLTGRWCRENHPQRHAVQQGTWVRTGRHGRTGHDSSLLVAAGTAGFANRTGQVWATHLGWSGNHEQYLDSLADGRRMLGAAELLGSAEVVLAALAASAGSSEIFLDVPSVNRDAIALAQDLGLEPVFETARMYKGAIPALRLERVFGVTTFELG